MVSVHKLKIRLTSQRWLWPTHTQESEYGQAFVWMLSLGLNGKLQEPEVAHLVGNLEL